MKATTSLTFSMVGVFLIVVSHSLFGEGMFMDGTYYATIARNMSEGLGTFWKPHLTSTVAPVFVDHPPLAFGLQSVFFSLFGDHLWVENIYSLLCYSTTAFLSIKIFQCFAKTEQKFNYWIFILLWMTVPKMTWSVAHNLLENTLMVFTTASIWLQLLYLKKQSKIYLIVAAVCLLLGFLTKGFVAFFPLSFLFFYRITEKKIKLKGLIAEQLIWILIVIFIIGTFFLTNASARENIMAYLNVQIFQNMTNEVTVGSRFFILRKAIEENLTQIILTILLFIFLRKKSFLKFSNYLALLLTALSGVIPILVTMKQSTFYINPTFPLFSIFFTLIVSELLSSTSFFDKLNSNKIISQLYFPLVWLIIGVSASYYFSSQTTRNKAQLEDIKTVIEYIGQEKQIAIGQDLRREWSYHGYFHRYGKVSLNWDNRVNYPYFISRTELDSSLTNYFKPTDIPLNELKLFVKKSN